MEFISSLGERQILTDYINLIEKFKVIVYVMDGEGHYVFANEPFQKLFGYTVEELKGKSFNDLFIIKNSIGDFTDGFIKNMPLQGKDKAGGTLNLEVISLTELKNFIIIHTIESTTHSFTKEKKYLNISTNSLPLIEATPLAYIALDLNKKVTIWNQTAEEMFGWKREEVINQPNPIIPSFYEKEFKDLFSYVITGNSITDLETVRKKKDGILLEVRISTTSIYDQNGNVNGYLAII